MKLRKLGILQACGWVLLLLFLLSLIPIFCIGVFDRMCCDDYDFSVLTREAIREQGTVGGLLHAAGQTVQTIYETWQGTYGAVFLFSLQPAIWGQSWYALTPMILIGTLVLGLGVFLRAVCEDVLRLKKHAWGSVWMLSALLCVQFPRDASEGFFWYNGGMFYTFFFGLLCLWLGLAARLLFRERKSRVGAWLRGILLVLLSGMIAGGNYPTALLLGMLFAGFLLWSALRNRKALPALLLSLAVFGVGFYFNITAPGNSVRQALLEQQTPLNAILGAITGTPVRMFGQLLRHPGAAALLLLAWAPLSLALVEHQERPFRFPLLVPLASWLVLAAMFTPSYYAMGNAGSYRLWNIVIFACYLLLLFNVFYFAGWWKRRWPTSFSNALAFLKKRKRIAPLYLLVVVVFSVLLSGAGPSFGIERESATSVRAMQALQGGRTRAYAEAFDRQAEAIEYAAGGDATVRPIPEPDALIPDGDLADYIPKNYDPSRWFDHNLNLELPN